MRPILVKRLLISILVFAAVYVYVTHVCSGSILEWIIQRGRDAGCQVVELGRLVWFEGGPFVGEDLKTKLFNSLARNGVWTIGAVSGLAAAMTAYSACRWLEHWRPLGYRGPTRCGGCGYILAGLREPRCPECGREI